MALKNKLHARGYHWANFDTLKYLPNRCRYGLGCIQLGSWPTVSFRTPQATHSPPDVWYHNKATTNDKQITVWKNPQNEWLASLAFSLLTSSHS